MNKKQTIGDEINNILKPKELTEENEEIEATVDDFSEFRGNEKIKISEIRKQNAKQLSDLSSKYKGKAVTRKELEAENGDVSESESDEQSLENESESEDPEEEGSQLDESESELEDEEENTDDDDYGDFDLSQFAKPQQQKNEKGESAAVLVKDSSTSKNEDTQKGICVQNQLKMWEKLLEVRIKAQKMLITANSLPDYDAFLDLSERDEDLIFQEKVDSTCDNVYNLMDNLLELQTTLVGKFSESKDVFKGMKRKAENEGNSSIFKRSKLSEYADKIEDNFEAYKSFRNGVLQKWHDRTKNLKDSRNPAMNLSIINKIDNALLGKNEMIRKTQIYRGDFELFAPVEKDSDDEEIILPEIFDDSDFYHQLLRELIEFKSNIGDNQSEITQKFIELQKVRNKMKRKVEKRASKGRMIRYNVHNKLVNFMPCKDTSEWTDEAKNELFNSLFGSNLS